jgi:hypothetical protein
MRRPGANHLDRQRKLTPRDYFDDPNRFGRIRHLAGRVPPGGDPVSARVAALQHRLVWAWQARGRKPSTSELGGLFGFSKSTWSRVILGQRWMGETIMAALLHAALQPGDSPTAEPPSGAAGVSKV